MRLGGLGECAAVLPRDHAACLRHQLVKRPRGLRLGQAIARPARALGTELAQDLPTIAGVPLAVIALAARPIGAHEQGARPTRPLRFSNPNATLGFGAIAQDTKQDT